MELYEIWTVCMELFVYLLMSCLRHFGNIPDRIVLLFGQEMNRFIDHSYQMRLKWKVLHLSGLPSRSLVQVIVKCFLIIVMWCVSCDSVSHPEPVGNTPGRRARKWVSRAGWCWWCRREVSSGWSGWSKSPDIPDRRENNACWWVYEPDGAWWPTRRSLRTCRCGVSIYQLCWGVSIDAWATTRWV